MKRDHEEAISRVFTALRNTESSAGLEYRVLEAVERRAAAQPASRFCGSSLIYGLTHLRFYGTRPLAWVFALGAMLVMVWFSFTSHQAAHPTRRVEARPAMQAEFPALPKPPRSIPSGSPARAHTVSTAQIPLRRSAVLRSARAASRPAPVAPLTKEEKLLVRIAHTGDPLEMAMLNPEIRSQQAADSEAKFKRFVEQSSKGDQE